VLNPQNRQAIAQTLESVRRLTATVASHTGEIDSAITDSTASLHDLRLTLETAQAILASLNQVLAPGGTLAAAIQSVNDTSKKFALTADRVNALLENKGDATVALRAVGDSAHKLSDVAERVDKLLAENGPGLRNFSREGLDQVEMLVAQTQQLVAQMSRIADTIERNPSQIIYGDRRQGYRPQ